MAECNSWQQKAFNIHDGKYEYSKFTYTSMKSKSVIICPEHGEFQQSMSSHIYSKAGCPICANINKKIKNYATHESVMLKLNDIFNYDFPIFEYSGQKSKIKFICDKHGLQEQLLNNMLQGHGCKDCSKEKMIYDMTMVSDDIIKNCLKIHKYTYPDKDYNLQSHGNIICDKHGPFTQIMSNHMHGQGCPSCNTSQGEKQILKYLTDCKIAFKHEYKFDDCLDKSRLRFDFYLSDLNICIEYDGIQHFEEVEFFGGKEAFIETQRRDKIKNDYCKDNDIKLIRISYKNKKNIDKILEKELNEYM